MKLKRHFLLLSCAAMGVLGSHAQCVTLNSVTVDNPQTSTVVLNGNGATQILGPDGIETPDQNGNFVLQVLTTVITNPTAGLQVFTLAPTFCPTTIQFQQNLLVNENEIVSDATSGCGACDGSICYAGSPSFDFSLNGVSSTNSCFESLCGGEYTISFDPQIGLGGVIYQYYDLEVTVSDFEVGFEVVGGQIIPLVNGGSGNYTIETFPLIESNVPSNTVDEAGCITVQVTDNVTGCSVSFTDHYNFGFESADVTGGPDQTPDGFVNTADLLLFLGDYGEFLGDPGYVSQMDFNCDGAVNTADLLIWLQAAGFQWYS